MFEWSNSFILRFKIQALQLGLFLNLGSTQYVMKSGRDTDSNLTQRPSIASLALLIFKYSSRSPSLSLGR